MCGNGEVFLVKHLFLPTRVFPKGFSPPISVLEKKREIPQYNYTTKT